MHANHSWNTPTFSLCRRITGPIRTSSPSCRAPILASSKVSGSSQQWNALKTPTFCFGAYKFPELVFHTNGLLMIYGHSIYTLHVWDFLISTYHDLHPLVFLRGTPFTGFYSAVALSRVRRIICMRWMAPPNVVGTFRLFVRHSCCHYCRQRFKTNHLTSSPPTVTTKTKSSSSSASGKFSSVLGSDDSPHKRKFPSYSGNPLIGLVHQSSDTPYSRLHPTGIYAEPAPRNPESCYTSRTCHCNFLWLPYRTLFFPTQPESKKLGKPAMIFIQLSPKYMQFVFAKLAAAKANQIWLQ